MKNLQQILKRTQKIATDNSPAILTALAVSGTVTTAYFTGKASFKAAQILESERRIRSLRLTGQEDSHFSFTAKEKIEMLWKLYIPAAGVGCFTVASIILANRIGSRRTAAMAAAYTISERAYSEYKEKVVETIGKNKEQGIRDQIAQDRVREHPPSSTIIVGEGKSLCHDAYSGRYFSCDMETLRRAENNVNRQILQENYATVSNFYNNIGLDHTSVSDEMGWNTDKFLELLFSSVIVEEDGPHKGKPALSFDFATVPHRNPWQFC